MFRKTLLSHYRPTQITFPLPLFHRALASTDLFMIPQIGLLLEDLLASPAFKALLLRRNFMHSLPVDRQAGLRFAHLAHLTVVFVVVVVIVDVVVVVVELVMVVVVVVVWWWWWW